MTSENTNVILVGVDGSSADETAIEYAAVEARRSGATLRLVHVLPDETRAARMYPLVVALGPGESRRIGRDILRDALGKAAELVGSDRVRADLLQGGRVSCLVHAARDARLVVLGDVRRSALGRLVTGSTLTGVAARATTPVVAVPASWRAGSGGGAVVAAVKSCETATGLVARALDIALERGTTLVLLHAWELPTAYDDLVVARLDHREIERDTRAALDGLLARVTEGRARDELGVPVELRVVHGQPAAVLVAAAASADLVLLARRPHAFPLGHLGATGRAVLREGSCPVEVLPPAGEPTGLGLVLERDGELEKAAERGTKVLADRDIATLAPPASAPTVDT